MSSYLASLKLGIKSLVQCAVVERGGGLMEDEGPALGIDHG
jgi:hypothetical protein